MNNEKKMSILKHLEELRRVLIVSFISIIPTSAVGWYFRLQILKLLTKPVDKMHYKLVYIGPTEAFVANIQLAIMAGVILASPIIIWQIWSFVAPALKQKEKKSALVVIPVSMLLFVGGVVFGYFTVFNFGIEFLLGFGGESLAPMLSLSKYLSFAFWFLLPFGLIFEMPLVILFLTRIGIVTPEFLAKNRRYAILLIFIISAVVTPTTDMLSQFAMGGPMYILYEISIWLSRFMKVKRNQQEAEEEEEDEEDEEDITEQSATDDDQPTDIPTVTEEPAQEDSVPQIPASEAYEASLAADSGEAEATEERPPDAPTEETGEKVETSEVPKVITPTDEEDNLIIPFVDEDPKTKRLEDIYKNITDRGNGNKDK